jgi:LPS-assembly protein
VENSYDIDAYHEEGGKPFGDITAELDLTPGKYFSLDADAAWSPNDYVFNSHNAGFNLWDTRGDQFSTTYRYNRESSPDSVDAVASISMAAQIVVNANWRLNAGYEYNLYADKEIESRLGVSYQAQCWGIDLEQVASRTSRGYLVVFHLKGLGSIGR